jgi:aspartate carbamoyltransferase catalytic subunit
MEAVETSRAADGAGMTGNPAGASPEAAAADIKPALALRHRDLLGIADLTAEEIVLILDTAEAMKEVGQRAIKKVPTLRGRTVINLFFEPSTRTRTSFEIAEKRLSADTLNVAIGTSSVVKGETLVDTALNLEAMSPSMIVLRHASSGACHLLARVCRAAIINAGDGMHEHPTQALLDAFTIRERKGRIRGLKVAILGDLLHSRVLRSNLLLLTRLGAEVWVCGPSTLIPPGLDRLGVRVTTRVDEAAEGADVIMMLRIQLERMQGGYFPSLREYFRTFGMTQERVARARPDVIIMHPGPINRGVEIASEVADGSASVILDQVANGVAVRMAVLYLLAGGAEHEAAA